MATDLLAAKDVNGYRKEHLNPIETVQMENGIDGEGRSETKPLLSPRRGGTARKSDRTRRNVQWNDRNGDKLAEVVEFEPSEASDSEDEESDSCICTIM